ncbi:uncharacterized protein LOC128156795 [Crassostrea angulata]|uniref:uncharacterized protein LOC128156795 n=1 Tax=Magallana angulata TaxID=2784310 RepID=UPI0022B1A8C0|nr:uncharacterized protein LOC128156795 [Crassostrea angulata]
MAQLAKIFLTVIFLVEYVLSGCNEKWKTIVKTGKDGKEKYGRKRDLVNHLMAGDDIRFSLSNGLYFTSIQSAILTGDENICVQALFHIGKSGYNTFRSDGYWWFLNICTSGHVHVSRWYVGAHTDRGQTKLTYDITWFARSRNCQAKPVYCNLASGWRKCGDVSLLANSVLNGASVKVLSPQNGYITSFTNIAVSGDRLSVAGQYPWHVSQSIVNNHAEFKSNVYWWATIWSTTGRLEMSRWNVGEHTSRGKNSMNTPMEWFVDDCWIQAYSHNRLGHKTDGSLDLLFGAVLAGRRVRVKIGSYIVEADNLYVRNGHVSAQLLGQLSKSSIFDFQTDVYWYWQTASTTGDVETVRYNIGSTHNRGNSADKHAITWFIETRSWSKVLSTSSAGSVTHGSKADLITALQAGSQLRLVVHEAVDSFSIIEADNIAIENSEVAAQSLKYISDENGSGGIPRQFKTPPYWRFTLTSTDGNQRAVWWKVGDYQSLPVTTWKYPVDWIVD